MSTSKDLKGRSMSDKKSMPGYMWLLAGLILGLFVALLVFLQKQPAETISLKEAVIAELEKAKINKENTLTATEKNIKKINKKFEPKFDFYTILPELEVLIPESEINTAIKNSPKIKQIQRNLKKSKKYILQVGSFKSLEDAERLKASLALLGLQSIVKTVSINQDNWHRVRLGPFKNLSSLQKTLSTLKNNNISAMSMELKD